MRRSWSASAATSPRRPTWRRSAAACRSSCTRPIPAPGLANRLGARLTRHVYTGQPATKLAHATCIGIPIRREIAGLDRLALSDKARAHFGLRPDLPVLLVTGGSQGARSLNQAVLGAAGVDQGRRRAGAAYRRAAGRHRWPAPPSPDAPYITVPYVDRMDLAYAAADFALVRGRRDDLRGTHRGGPARRLRAASARKRRAAAERRPDRAGRRRAHRGRRRAEPGLDPRHAAAGAA